MMSSRYNYVGIGLAFRSSTGQTSGPSSSRRVATSRGRRHRWSTSRGPVATLTWRWTGADAPLQTHTAGLATYRVEARVGSGAWTSVRPRPPRPRERSTVAPGTGTGSGSRHGEGPGNSRPLVEGTAYLGALTDVRRQPFAAVNLISDPIHGYVELTKRLGARRVGGGRAAGRGRRRGGPPRHGVAPAAAPDQPAPERPLGLPDRRALPVHPRPRGHARGGPVGAGALSDPADGASPSAPASRSRRRASSSRRSGWRGSSTTWVTGRSPTSSTITSCADFPAPGRPAAAGRQAAHPRGPVAADHRATSSGR